MSHCDVISFILFHEQFKSSHILKLVQKQQIQLGAIGTPFCLGLIYFCFSDCTKQLVKRTFNRCYVKCEKCESLAFSKGVHISKSATSVFINALIDTFLVFADLIKKIKSLLDPIQSFLRS